MVVRAKRRQDEIRASFDGYVRRVEAQPDQFAPIYEVDFESESSRHDVFEARKNAGRLLDVDRAGKVQVIDTEPSRVAVVPGLGAVFPQGHDGRPLDFSVAQRVLPSRLASARESE